MPVARKIKWFNKRVQKELATWPKIIKIKVAGQLRGLAKGEIPPGVKPLTGLGSGVYQLRAKGHRVVVTHMISRVCYVIHVFKKDSKENKKTRKHHLDIITQRIKSLRNGNS